jgi:hypothetical protein
MWKNTESEDWMVTVCRGIPPCFGKGDIRVGLYVER